MQIRLASEIQTDSIVDGEGLRAVVWAQGCSHDCKGCHNQHTHDFGKGILMDTGEIMSQILKLRNQDGITFSGGDPFFQAEAFSEIAKFCKYNNINVWCYTGFTLEELLKISKIDENTAKLLENIDVLIDGRFEEEKKDLNLFFRGSSNQRIINIPKSLKKQRTVEINKYKKPKNEKYGYIRNKTLFI